MVLLILVLFVHLFACLLACLCPSFVLFVLLMTGVVLSSFMVLLVLLLLLLLLVFLLLPFLDIVAEAIVVVFHAFMRCVVFGVVVLCVHALSFGASTLYFRAVVLSDFVLCYASLCLFELPLRFSTW